MAYFQLNFGSTYGGSLQHEQARPRLVRRIRDLRWRPALLLQITRRERQLDGLEFGDARNRTHGLHPSEVRARRDAVQLVEGVVTMILFPQIARHRIEREPEAVANPVGEQPLQVAADITADAGAEREERVIRRRAAVVIEPQDHAGKMRTVGTGPAEQIIGRAVAGGAIGQVLHLTAPAGVTENDVQLAVAAKPDHATVVIATRHAVGARRSGTIAG